MFCTYNNDLIVGTTFFNQGLIYIARYDGNTWHPLASGLNSTVRALRPNGQQLVAAGGFSAGFGGQSPGLNKIAVWQDCGAACPADITGDSLINVNDLLAVINAWGACQAPPNTCPADITQDGQINVNDLLSVINAWGSCP